MADSMIERVAATLKAEIGYPADGEDREGQWMVEGGFRGDDFFNEIARSILTAMREPTDDMRDPFTERLHWDDLDQDEVWRVMIDAAQEEGR